MLKLTFLPRPRGLELERAFPRHDWAALRKMPKKTLGRAYVDFLDEHRLAPFEPSDAAFAKASTYALRYARRRTISITC